MSSPGESALLCRTGFGCPPTTSGGVSLIGGAGDWKNEDLSEFGVEGGKLRWVAPLEDLRRRLIGSTVEEFLARKDVEFVLGIEDMGGVDEDVEVAEKAMQRVRQEAVEKVRQWCAAHGEAPHPRLPEAMDTVLEALQQMSSIPEETDADAPQLQEGADNIRRLLSMDRPEVAKDLADALDQIGRFAGEFKSGQEFADVVFGEQADDEEEPDRP